MNKSKKQTIFNPYFFINEITPESSYILGLLWADGYLGNNLNCAIRIEMIKSDLSLLSFIFNKTGRWNYYYRKREHWQPQMLASINNRPLYEFLVLHDYKDKSGISANKILKYIPTNLYKYFFRGLVDGDGSFYINKKHYVRHFICASSYNQDWSYFENLLKALEIPYRIDRRSHINKTGKENKQSTLRITCKLGITRWGDYIYDNYVTDQIGLHRKFKKYQEICKSYK